MNPTDIPEEMLGERPELPADLHKDLTPKPDNAKVIAYEGIHSTPTF